MFPLTNIASAGSGKELSLPGVHSDIGGGYKNGELEEVILSESSRRLKEEKQRVLEQGWFNKEQLTESMFSLKGKRESVSNEYSLVILHLMAEFGKLKYKIPWKYGEFLNNSMFYKVPSALDTVKERVYGYAFEGESALKFYTKDEIEAKRKKTWNSEKERGDFNLKVRDHNMLNNLRNKYLHCSASMDGVAKEPRMTHPDMDGSDEYREIIWKRFIIPG
jgi:hypothetical protein